MPHILLVFREMWDTTVLDRQLCRFVTRGEAERICRSLIHAHALCRQTRTPLDYDFSVTAWSAGISSPAQILLAVHGAADPAQNGSLAGNPNGSQAAEQR